MKYEPILKDPEPNYEIPGLELISPLGSSEWGDTIVYYPPSFDKKISNEYPLAYIYKRYNEGVGIFNHKENRELCLSEFLKLMTKDEQNKFISNIDKIITIFYRL